MSSLSEDTILAVGRVLVGLQLLREAAGDTLGYSADLSIALCEITLVTSIESDLRPVDVARLRESLSSELSNGLVDCTNGVITHAEAGDIVGRNPALADL